MSTDGTLYDETVKFGYGKLLQSVNVTGGTVYVVFTTPFNTNYDTLMFEFVNPNSNTDSAIMGCRVSFDGGASFPSTSYWWTQQYNFSSDAGGGTYGSCSFSQTGSADAWQYLNAGSLISTPVFGELYIHRNPARPFHVMDWHSVHMHGYNFISAQGGGMCVAGNFINGIQFFFNASTFQSGSIIRCYGLKKGAFGS